VPGVVAYLAARARAGANNDRATARMRARDGRWLTISASALDDDAGSVAVVVEPSAGEAVMDSVLRALGLSGRERQVAALCARGQPAKVIASELSLSPWTVQDHLKAIYAKTGTGSRPELARLFSALTPG
jgi:DNA-binding CsgD family transcriptional regulator